MYGVAAGSGLESQNFLQSTLPPPSAPQGQALPAAASSLLHTDHSGARAVHVPPTAQAPANVIFLCDPRTEEECIQRQLLGLPRSQTQVVRSIVPEVSLLFLFNVRAHSHARVHTPSPRMCVRRFARPRLSLLRRPLVHVA